MQHMYNVKGGEEVTYLTNFLGMYRIWGLVSLSDLSPSSDRSTVENISNGDIRFIVMLNAFPPDRSIHKRFDLKVYLCYLLLHFHHHHHRYYHRHYYRHR